MTDVKEPSPKELALKNIPTAWRERLISEAAYVGCKSDDDVLWTVIASVINAWASAGAAGRAADAVQSSIDKIPDRIYQGALKAGNDINSQFEKKFGEYGQTLIAAVNKARDDAAAQIKQGIQTAGVRTSESIQLAGNNVKVASQTLENMLNGVIEQKAKQGLVEWAEAARIAGQNAAEAASHGIYSKASIIMGGALLLAVIAGGGIMYFVTANRMTPLPVYHTPHGHSLCFESKGNGYCQLSGTKQQLSKLRYDPPSNL
ncbi:hypothetical protein HF670_08060 [Acidithiobacillus thiooxidans]|jgi:hypothetical protein|uniref:hypothetical protein n=1 Tax=Acidithiobacillus thiooxidans TaxID=930 RepID=UPI001C078329|nr:hypothetical protein [Acidithiobacillus thiooxidans]MBU2839516.1 hypothetical protein [Acidithiobacillus thiooxidans]MBU2841866.1 hypothetical protein [Acidithiobacillus thiooxidans]